MRVATVVRAIVSHCVYVKSTEQKTRGPSSVEISGLQVALQIASAMVNRVGYIPGKK